MCFRKRAENTKRSSEQQWSLSPEAEMNLVPGDQEVVEKGETKGTDFSVPACNSLMPRDGLDVDRAVCPLRLK